MSPKNVSLALICSILSIAIWAQVHIDKPIELTGGAGDRKITALESPVDGTDAVNKDYVDNAISSGGGPFSPTMVSAESASPMSFPNAVFYCRDLDESGFTDWSLALLTDLCLLRTGISGYQTATDYIWTAAGPTLFRLSDGYITSPPSYNASYSNTVLNNCCSHKARCTR